MTRPTNAERNALVRDKTKTGYGYEYLYMSRQLHVNMRIAGQTYRTKRRGWSYQALRRRACRSSNTSMTESRWVMATFSTASCTFSAPSGIPFMREALGLVALNIRRRMCIFERQQRATGEPDPTSEFERTRQGEALVSAVQTLGWKAPRPLGEAHHQDGSLGGVGPRLGPSFGMGAGDNQTEIPESDFNARGAAPSIEL